MNSKAPTSRQLKISENIKRILANEFSINKIQSNLVGDVHITVSLVRMSSDLKNAKIYIIPDCKEDELEDVIKLLNEYSYIFKKSIASKTNLKYMPNLKFFYDDVYNQVNKLENILSNLDNE
jgi:ribosome-binding factor A